AVLCVFAPRNLPEFARVLADTGVLVVVTPNAGHLARLRERYGLLGVPTGKADQLQDAAAEHFRRLGSERLTRTAEVDAQRVADLIGMGPNAFHGLPDRVGAEAVTIDVTVQTFRPLPTAALPLPR
ncbi:MAG: SAM-dependent methyltransferase, partial [Propionicimonas sp.]